jgi:putative ABC transport system permease protein
MLTQDLKYAVRALWKERGLTAIVIACLGLGIGINATLFAVIDGVLIQPLPFAEPDQLVVLEETRQRQADFDGGVSYQNLRDFQERASSAADFAALAGRSLALSDGASEPERVQGGAITWNLFPMLGVAPALGRHFTRDDDRPGAAPVVIINNALWQRRYQSDPSIVGRSVMVNARPHTVIAVMPGDFGFPNNFKAWVPLGPTAEAEARDNRYLLVFGRLRPGVALAAANTEIEAIGRRLAEQFPDTNRDWTARLRPASEEFTPADVTLILSTMMGAVTLVLLIACANVANLMLARASVRHREFSVRAALGAGRRRMARQLLTECVILGLASAPLGIAIAALGVYLLDNAVPPDSVPYYIRWAIDARSIVYTTVVAALTGVVFGMAPALQAGRLNILESLRDGSRGAGSSGRRARVRHALVVAEVALAIVLLVGASLFVRSFLNRQGASPGFDTAPLLTLRIFMSGDPYREPVARAQRVEDILRRIGALPGVDAAYASNFIPLDAGGGGGAAMIEGRDAEPGEEPFIGFIGVTPQFVKTIGIALTRGRDFTDAEGRSRTPVAVIDETMASRFWSGQDAVGRRFRLIAGDTTDWFTVIGVTRDLRPDDPDDEEAPSPTAFVPYPYAPTPNTGIAIRVATRNPTAIAGAAREAIRASDPGLPIFNVRSMEDVRTLSFWQFRLFGVMFAIFGGVALVLAAIGVYGVLSFAVSQRTQEIGLRMALGAQDRDVRRMVVGQGLRLAAIGVALGLVGAFGITRVIRTLLYNIEPTDPLSFGGVAIFLTLIALAASYLPARRATMVDPMVALRSD